MREIRNDIGLLFPNLPFARNLPMKLGIPNLGVSELQNTKMRNT